MRVQFHAKELHRHSVLESNGSSCNRLSLQIVNKEQLSLAAETIHLLNSRLSRKVRPNMDTVRTLGHGRQSGVFDLIFFPFTLSVLLQLFQSCYIYY